MIHDPRKYEWIVRLIEAQRRCPDKFTFVTEDWIKEAYENSVKLPVPHQQDTSHVNILLMTYRLNNKCQNITKSVYKKEDPIVTGKDLIKVGYNPGKIFGEILKFAYNLQLADTKLTKQDLLKCIENKFSKS